MTLGPLKAELEQLQLEYSYAKLAYENQVWYCGLISKYPVPPAFLATELKELEERLENLKKAYRSLVRIRV